MKSVLRLVYVALVGVVVFMGALYIAEGMRAQQERPQSAAATAQAATPDPFDALNQEEGSAL